MIGIFDLLFGAKSAELKDAFALGYKAGVRDGIKEGMSKQFEKTRELTDEEYQGVIKYLIDNNISACYDPLQGGFRFRKELNYRKDIDFSKIKSNL